MLGLALILFYAAIAVSASSIAPYSPTAFVGTPFQPPSASHLFGTDNLGRDVFSETIYGIGISLFVGVAIATISAALGLVFGALSGYYGGILDMLISGATELFLVLSAFFLALMLSVIFRGSLGLIIVAGSVVLWTRPARLLRGEFLILKTREFVMSARAMGASNLDIIFKEILPYGLWTVLTAGTLVVGEAVLLEAGLSFIGAGDPNVVSLGLLLNYAQPYVFSAQWMVIGPGLGLSGLIIAFTFVGDALNEALNPKVRGL